MSADSDESLKLTQSSKKVAFTIKRYWPKILIIFFTTVIFTFLSFLRYEEFYTTNWDLGINMQLLWTGSHGYLLWSTGNFSSFSGQIYSFLQVHSTYIALILSYVYAVLPGAVTLFVIQSFVLSASIIPLYLIAREIKMDGKLAIASGIFFLVNFGLISGMLYDFHWEMFIPLEFFTVFYLMMKKKYLLSLIPFAIGCATLEVFPFLMVGIVLYFIVDRYGFSFVRIRDSFGKNRVTKLLFVISVDRKNRLLVLTALLVISLISYVLIRVLQIIVIPEILGIESHNALQGVTGSVTFLFIPTVTLSSASTSLVYWLILYASLGFIPILHPRHIILELPWIFNTFILSPSFSTWFGNQYAVLALAPMFLGFLFGVAKIKDMLSKGRFKALLLTPISAVSVFLGVLSINSKEVHRLLQAPANPENYIMALSLLGLAVAVAVSVYMTSRLEFRIRLRYSWLRNRHALTVMVALVVVGLLVFNIALSPLNTENKYATPMPGYQFSYSANPAYQYIQSLTDSIPKNAYILASDNLFPFVANDPNAYSLLWYTPPPSTFHLPFNISNLPDYVFVDTGSIYILPSYYSDLLFNSSIYGLKGYIYYNSFPGAVYLFQKGYSGKTAVYFASAPKSIYYFYGNELAIGASGRVVKSADSKFGTVIESQKAENSSGNGQNIWYGPYYVFTPGWYNVTICLKGGLAANLSGVSGNVPILRMLAYVYGRPGYFNSYISSNQLSNSTWTYFNYTIYVAYPYPDTQFTGYLDYNGTVPNGFVELNYIEVQQI